MKSRIVVPMLTSLLFAGCAGTHAPPVELQNARAELVRAKQTSGQLNPTDVHAAEVALQRAEQAFADDPDSPATADLAAVAQLKAQIAVAATATLLANEQALQAQRDLQAAQAAQLQSTRGALQQTQGALQQSQGALQQSQGALQQSQGNLNRTRDELATERARRAELEAQLKAARETLAKIAQVKDDDRGMVVTFQGEALFKTAKWDLLPAAMVKLDQVSETLKGQERKILVVGHTDNQGGAGQYNQNLSEKRAQAVRDYLVSKGIPADLIRSEGRGPSQPVAENTSIEGRAANRRVEIIVEPSTK